MTKLLAFLLTFIALLTMPTRTDEAELRAIMTKFADARGFPQIEAVVEELGATGDQTIARAERALRRHAAFLQG